MPIYLRSSGQVACGASEARGGQWRGEEREAPLFWPGERIVASLPSSRHLLHSQLKGGAKFESVRASITCRYDWPKSN